MYFGLKYILEKAFYSSRKVFNVVLEKNNLCLKSIELAYKQSI